MANETAEADLKTEDLRSEILIEKKGESKSSGKKPWEVRMEQDHPELVPEKREEKEAEEVKEPKEKEESPSEEQPDETKEQPAEEQPSEESQPAESAPDTAKEDAYIAEYAKKNSLEPAVAKEEVSRLRAIATKYGNDPVQLAKAYREQQSAYDKLKTQASSNVNPAVAAISANPRSYIAGEVKKNQENLIVEFREQNPARSRDMDDEQVVEELVERGTYAIKDRIRGYEIQLKKDAASKRDEFISKLPDADKRFLPEIKPILEQLPDHQIVSDSFRFDDLVKWARGGSVDRMIKEAEDRIHKQYQNKDKKIVGEIAKAPQTTKVKAAADTNKAIGMTKYQKDQALQMFASAGMTDDEKYEAYLEVTKRNKK